MPSPKDDPKILHEWREIFSQYTAQGIKKSNAYYRIAEAYEVSYTTVRYHLNSEYRARTLNAQHERYKKRSQRRIQIEMKRSRRRIQIRRYNRNYRRLIRNPEQLLSLVFESAEQMSAEGISEKIPKLCEGVHFWPATIQKHLDCYIAQERGPPYLRQKVPDIYYMVDESVRLNLH